MAINANKVMSLFAKLEPDDAAAASRPLAERMRPRTLEEFAGQQELLGPGKPLRVAIEHDDLGSMILWGPPGCGKTTLARLIARRTHSEFIAFSAVLSGIREIKDVMAAAGLMVRSDLGRRLVGQASEAYSAEMVIDLEPDLLDRGHVERAPRASRPSRSVGEMCASSARQFAYVSGVHAATRGSSGRNRRAV